MYLIVILNIVRVTKSIVCGYKIEPFIFDLQSIAFQNLLLRHESAQLEPEIKQLILDPSKFVETMDCAKSRIEELQHRLIRSKFYESSLKKTLKFISEETSELATRTTMIHSEILTSFSSGILAAVTTRNVQGLLEDSVIFVNSAFWLLNGCQKSKY